MVAPSPRSATSSASVSDVDVLDVAVAVAESLHAACVDVDQDDAAPRLGEHVREGNPDVAGPDDRDLVGRGLGSGVRSGRLGRRHSARMLPARPDL